MRKKNKLWDACSAFFEVLAGRGYGNDGLDDVLESSQHRPTSMMSMATGHVRLFKATNGMILEVSIFSSPDSTGYSKENQPIIAFVPEEDMEKIGDVITRTLTISTLAAK